MLLFGGKVLTESGRRSYGFEPLLHVKMDNEGSTLDRHRHITK